MALYILSNTKNSTYFAALLPVGGGHALILFRGAFLLRYLSHAQQRPYERCLRIDTCLYIYTRQVCSGGINEPSRVYRRVKHSEGEPYDKEKTYPRLSS